MCELKATLTNPSKVIGKIQFTYMCELKVYDNPAMWES